MAALPDFQEETNAAIVEMNKITSGLDQQEPIAAWEDDPASYDFPDVVAGSDGYSYRCVGTDVVGVDPVTDDGSSWVRLTTVGTPEKTADTLVARDGDGNTKVGTASHADHAMSRSAMDARGDARYAPIQIPKLNCKVVEIGDWNMDATSEVYIPHGLTLSKIRSASAMIRSDTGGTQHMLTPGSLNDERDGELLTINTVDVTLRRKLSGGYDSAAFDSTSYNRGWITIWYVD
jgi:hypothetical protein